MHRTQGFLRHVPESVRKKLDAVSGIVPLPGLLVESTSADLIQSMNESRIDYAWVIAHSPLMPNEFVMDLCSRNPRLIPVVNMPQKASKPVQLLKAHFKRGAKALKLHPAADGEAPDSPRYRKLVRTATAAGVPIIIHTGCIHSRLLFKDPEQSRAERLVPLLKAFPETTFILAHMNFHDPNTAFDLAEKYPNIYLESSWQPAEVIGEAVRRIGAERILFGSDWPLVGSNLSIGLSRIRECVAAGTLSPEESRLVLGENAARLIGLKVEAHAT